MALRYFDEVNEIANEEEFEPRSVPYSQYFGEMALSDDEKETVRKCMRAKYKGRIVGDPKIDEFLEELEHDHGIRLKRLPVTSVVAV